MAVSRKSIVINVRPDLRDPERIRRILQLLEETWALVPDWRLTQLVINAADHDHNCGPVFYEEDDLLEKKLRFLKESLEELSHQKEQS